VCGVPVVACDNRFWLYTWTVRTKFSQCFLLPGCKRRECDLRQGCFVVFRSEELKGCGDIGLMIVLGSVLFSLLSCSGVSGVLDLVLFFVQSSPLAPRLETPHWGDVPLPSGTLSLLTRLDDQFFCCWE